MTYHKISKARDIYIYIYIYICITLSCPYSRGFFSRNQMLSIFPFLQKYVNIACNPMGYLVQI